MQKHWADQLADRIIEERGDKQRYVFNFGMSLSGRMHIGNLRGELLIPSRIKRILENRDKKVDFRGVFYTQDRFKGREGQLNEFDDPEEAKKYIGRRLIDVPDPKGCHGNWSEHYNSQNQPYFDRFGIDVDPISTAEFYGMRETKELVRTFLEEKDKVRGIINRFRKRKPHPEGWIPFDPFCEECRRIDKTEALDIDFDKGRVKYRCRACGEGGWSDFGKGKLSWRLEWVALWHVLDVDFEPYGKDRATPGGSRDSCVAISEEFGLNYPTGFPFNWVYWKRGDEVKTMTSSGSVGLTAQEYLRIAEPEILNYLYISTKPMKEIYFDPEDIPTYYRRFDRAESIYFGEENARSEKREKNIKRNYELAVNSVPRSKPNRVSYDTCAFVAQLTSEEEKSLNLLRKMEQISEDVNKRVRKNIIKRLEKARNWVQEYEPERYTVKIHDSVPDCIKEELSEGQKEALKRLASLLEEKDWGSEELQDRIYDLKDEYDISAGELFRGIYMSVLGQRSGPRAGQLIKAIGQSEVAKILESL